MKKLIYKTWFWLKGKLLRNDFAINGWPKERHLEIQKYLITVLNPQKEDEILEFGCGTGLHVRNFACLCKEVIGVDHLGSMFKRAKENNHGVIFIGDISSVLGKRWSFKSPVDLFNCAMCLFLNPFDIKKFCQQNFGATEIIVQAKSLLDDKQKFGLLINVVK